MTEPPRQNDPEVLDVAKSGLNFPVVGIGASAGGVAALQHLFTELPGGTGMAFVVVMHLSPDHESSLGSILQRASRLTVVTVTRSMPIEAEHVYVISPSKKLAMTDGHLIVTELSTQEGRRSAVDLFFRSLAQAHRERAVCAVLSGTGSDGTQGLKRIKELGGVCIAQSPEDAEFDGMPRAAIHTGLVDFILPAAEMPAKLIQLWENARRIRLPDPPDDLEVQTDTGDAAHLAEEALLSIKALLRERTGHNFAHYKRATVLRRLERRMQVNSLSDLPSYRRLLEVEPRETPALLQDMLISVTNFFRDPDAFFALAETLRRSIDDRPVGEPFRAWVAGCATGEEAYSIAILLRELLGPLGTPVQIFASDIDQRAIAVARTGVYPPSIAADLSADRLRDFFVADTRDYRISKSVRDSVVFSVHNVLSEPHFTRMDLVCCRNLLIYLERPAQAQLLRGFHFALKRGGLLFLGSSETADAGAGLFKAVDKRHRIYDPVETGKRATALLPIPSVRMAMPQERLMDAAVVAPPGRPLQSLHERVLRNHAPPTVLVDADDTALHVDERAAHLLRLPGGAPSNKLLVLARPELRAELRAALGRARESGRSVEARHVRLRVNGVDTFVSMTVRPVLDELPEGLFLVLFEQTDETMNAGIEGQARDPVVDSLEKELLRAQEDLRSTRGESAASTEELRASNEELQTINEELRSTTEELETSREELQAVNEELTTVNAELQAKIEETTKANDDLHNLMVSAEIGTVFVDREMRIKRFTPQSATIFNLLPSDAGRPLMDITHRLAYTELAEDAAEVLRSLRRVEREVRSADGRWFLARVLPYRTGEDRIDGVVFTFFDVSARRAAEESLRLSEQRMRLVAESMRDYAIVTTDVAGTIATWSPGAERVFGWEATEAVGKPMAMIFTPEDQQAGVPAQELGRARDVGRADDDRWHLRKDGQRIYCSGITTPLLEGGLVGYAKIARDYTDVQLRDRRREAALNEAHAARDSLQQASVMKDEFLAVMSHELKNPLAVIQMSAQLLARLPSFREEPRAARATDAIRSAVASQAQIINDLLELSRVNTGHVVLALSTVDLGPLVRNIVDAVAPDISAKSQRLQVDIPAHMQVTADAVRVEQMVWNLLTNAIKFTPERGEIRVSLAVDGHMAKLTVADSGLGVEPQNLLNIFEMFRQVETGPSRKKTGLGIGLALVRQLALLHGGSADATSEGLGRGAQFHVRLPLLTDPTRTASPVAGHGAQGMEGLRLLLVDDEVLMLRAFSELLKLEGAAVVAVDNAASAMEVARREDFDVVVSDIAMPEHDGYWLAQELRADPRTRGLAVVAVSGMAREADRIKAFEAGFDAHVAKPLELDMLRLEIAQAIARRAAPKQEGTIRGT